VTFRPAVATDSADLAILSDAATRRLSSFLWSSAAEPAQSSFEFGRNFILTQTGHSSHYSNWHVAELGRRVAGAQKPREAETRTRKPVMVTGR
jgi:hypothetical protein